MSAGNEEIIFAIYVASFIFLLLVLVVVLLVYNYFKVKNQRHHDILDAVFETQEAERDRISEELHDGVGGKLSALKLQNEMLLSENDPAQTAKYVSDNSRLIDSIVTDIRRMVRNQSSKYLLSNGLTSEMETLVRMYASVKKDLVISFSNESDTDYLHPNFQVSLFRILQELIHNSVKHADATKMDIRIFDNKNELQVTYSDNGKGFDGEAAADGMGMRNIRARCELYSGTLLIGVTGGNGVHFDFRFPFHAIFAETDERD
jgi:signal transduction histidine kinase